MSKLEVEVDSVIAETRELDNVLTAEKAVKVSSDMTAELRRADLSSSGCALLLAIALDDLKQMHLRYAPRHCVVFHQGIMEISPSREGSTLDHLSDL